MSDFDDDDMLYDSDAGSIDEVANEDDPAVRAENRYFEAKGSYFMQFYHFGRIGDRNGADKSHEICQGRSTLNL